MNSNCLGWDCSVRLQDCRDPYVCRNRTKGQKKQEKLRRLEDRKVPAAALGGLDGDVPARTFVEMQDREIGEKSGR